MITGSPKTLNKASFQMQGYLCLSNTFWHAVRFLYFTGEFLKSKLDLINNYSLSILPYNGKHRIINDEGMITKTLGCNFYLTLFIKHPKYYI